jgi:hypothetical protein
LGACAAEDLAGVGAAAQVETGGDPAQGDGGLVPDGAGEGDFPWVGAGQGGQFLIRETVLGEACAHDFFGAALTVLILHGGTAGRASG